MTYPFIAARWYTHTDARNIDVVVIHTAETPEGEDTAVAVARYFATTNTKASAHYCIDGGIEEDDAIVQCVLERDVAYAAPGANSNGIQLELAGRAGQDRAGWADEYSQRALKRAAKLTADICRRHAIPIVKIAASDLIARGSGICGHVDVTNAFHRSTHTDPGASFPWADFIGLVQQFSGGTPTTRVSSQAEFPPSVEVDMLINAYRVTMATDSNGCGWARVPYTRHRIIGHTPPGLRPGVDGRYLTCQVGFAEDDKDGDPGTIVSVEGWQPSGQVSFVLSVAS